MRHQSPTVPDVPAAPVTRLASNAEFDRARAEAGARLAAAEWLVAGERRRSRLVRLNVALASAAPTNDSRVAAFSEEAALTLVGHADRLKSRANSPTDALAAYRRAVELFPDTPWAAVARQRIEQLQSQIQSQEIPS